ncbi:hypothetical protein KXX03_004289 [Aspergillus fumigatus]|nr:hypothetical protein KXX03_004289 [Aspergillus fumigatus]
MLDTLPRRLSSGNGLFSGERDFRKPGLCGITPDSAINVNCFSSRRLRDRLEDEPSAE